MGEFRAGLAIRQQHPPEGQTRRAGYLVETDDAAAALADEEPLSADGQTFAEVRGYRQALGYVLQIADDPHFRFDASGLRSMHYMMLTHDLAKAPGRYRPGPVNVHHERTGEQVYEGPDAASVPELMDRLATRLEDEADTDPVVRAAMAHLNLVMIHPFRDGNGRMARALHTLVLSRHAIVEPAFSSVEEWLGHNTEDYYRALRATGRGVWRPEGDAALWVSFVIRAHHMQAQTVARRADEASRLWLRLDELVAGHRLHPLVADLLHEGVLGYRLRRGGYVKLAGIEERTATRDLTQLTETGLLEAVGERRGRYYLAGTALVELRREVREQRPPLEDPYPWLTAHLRSAAEQVA